MHKSFKLLKVYIYINKNIILDKVNQTDELDLWNWVKKLKINLEESQNSIVNMEKEQKNEAKKLGTYQNQSALKIRLFFFLYCILFK